MNIILNTMSICLNCLLLCNRFVIYTCKYSDRIPTASEFYQHVQKVKTVVKLIFSEKELSMLL